MYNRYATQEVKPARNDADALLAVCEKSLDPEKQVPGDAITDQFVNQFGMGYCVEGTLKVYGANVG